MRASKNIHSRVHVLLTCNLSRYNVYVLCFARANGGPGSMTARPRIESQLWKFIKFELPMYLLVHRFRPSVLVGKKINV